MFNHWTERIQVACFLWQKISHRFWSNFCALSGDSDVKRLSIRCCLITGCGHWITLLCWHPCPRRAPPPPAAWSGTGCSRSPCPRSPDCRPRPPSWRWASRSRSWWGRPPRQSPPPGPGSRWTLTPRTSPRPLPCKWQHVCSVASEMSIIFSNLMTHHGKQKFN